MLQINKNIYYYVIVCIYLVFLLFDIIIVNLVLPIVFIASFINCRKGVEDFKRYLKENKITLGLLILLILYQLIRAVIACDIGDKRIGFLGLLITSFIVLFRLKKVDLLIKTIIIVIFTLTLAGGYNIYQYYISTEVFTMSVGGHIDPMLIVARPYLGYVLNLGIILSLYQSNKVKGRVRCVYLVSALTFLLYMIFIAIRVQLVSLAMMFVLYFIFYNKMRIIKKTGILFGAIALVISVFFTNPTLKDRFELNALRSENVWGKLAEKEPRVVIWRCSDRIASEESFNPIFGLGKKEIVESKLSQCYEDSTHGNPMRQYFLDAQFNTHNQFIDYYLVSGMIGLLLLLAMFLKVGFEVRKNFYATALIVCLFNFCIVENLLDGQLGAYLFGFTLYLALVMKKSI